MRLSHPALLALMDAKPGDVIQVGYKTHRSDHPRIMDGVFRAGADIQRWERVEFDPESGDVWPARRYDEETGVQI